MIGQYRVPMRPELRQEFERAMAEWIEQGRQEREMDPLHSAWCSFLDRFDWGLFATLTFKCEVGPEQSETYWRRWIKKLEQHCYGPVWWARADEQTKSGRLHFHAVLGGPAWRNLRRLSGMDLWPECGSACGWARVEAPRSMAAIYAYVTKYVTKDGDVTVCPALHQAAGQTVAVLTPSEPARTRDSQRRPRGRRR